MPYEALILEEPESHESETPISQEREPRLKKLWAKYRFVGEPPFMNSPVEDRLKDVAKRYAYHVIFPERSSAMKTDARFVSHDSEDYFAAGRRKPISSDAPRRELHNQLSLMVMGTQRSGMDIALAEHIADFAVEYAYGISTHEADELKNGGTDPIPLW